jgi:hypothetical protein
MEPAPARPLFRFILFTLLFLAAPGVAFWYFLSKNAPAEPVGAAAEATAEPPSAGEAPPALPYEGAIPGSGLAIEGSSFFKRQVTRSLKLIWLYDKDSFNFIRKYVYIVRSGDKTSFVMHEGVPTILISEANTYKSDAWCAGIIAHHAWHSYFRFETLAAKRKREIPPPPGESSERIKNLAPNPMRFDLTTVRDIKAQEADADIFQLKVLKAVGASGQEMNSVRRRAAKDLSVSHDGSYSSKL